MFRADSVRTFLLTSDIVSADTENIYIEKFGIDDARELVAKAYNRPVEATEQVLVLRTNFITLEAQNALLKVLEEPPLSTRFIFVIPNGFAVLPTLASRFNEVVSINEIPELSTNATFTAFINNGYKERLTSIEQAMKKKDTDWQQLVKQGLTQYIKESADAKASLKELEYSVRHLLTRGASNKMLFEHIALILPTRLQ